MLADDSKPSMLLQQPGRMGPLRLKNRVVMLLEQERANVKIEADPERVKQAAERAKSG